MYLNPSPLKPLLRQHNLRVDFDLFTGIVRDKRIHNMSLRCGEEWAVSTGNIWKEKVKNRGLQPPPP